MIVHGMFELLLVDEPQRSVAAEIACIPPAETGQGNGIGRRTGSRSRLVAPT
jgi:hypothetical protein